MAAKPLPTPEYPQLSPAAPLSLPLPPANLCLLFLWYPLLRSLDREKKNIYIFFFLETHDPVPKVRERSRRGTCVKFKSKGVNIDFSPFLGRRRREGVFLNLLINFEARSFGQFYQNI